MYKIKYKISHKQLIVKYLIHFNLSLDKHDNEPKSEFNIYHYRLGLIAFEPKIKSNLHKPLSCTALIKPGFI